MSAVRLYCNLLIRDLGKLCRQLMLPAGLVLFCVSLLAGPAAGRLLSDGVDFEGLTIAITADDGDGTPALLETIGGNLRDVRQYCTFSAMSRGEAEAALASGEVSAVLDLPPGFLRGVMDSTNPDVTLTIPSDAPLRSLLSCTAGTAVVDMLDAFQRAIYSVLDSYDISPAPGLSRDEVTFQINLRCIGWALGREKCFKHISLSPAGALTAAEHYTLSLLAYLVLACAPLAAVLYEPRRLRAYRRLRCAGHGAGAYWATSVSAAALVLFPAVFAVMCLAGTEPLRALGAAAAWSVFASVGYAFFSLLVPTVSGCGTVSFLAAFAALFLSGGILPPVLLPHSLQYAARFSPVTAMRALAAGEVEVLLACALAVWCVLLAAAGLLLCRRRMERGEGTP